MQTATLQYSQTRVTLLGYQWFSMWGLLVILAGLTQSAVILSACGFFGLCTFFAVFDWFFSRKKTVTFAYSDTHTADARIFPQNLYSNIKLEGSFHKYNHASDEINGHALPAGRWQLRSIDGFKRVWFDLFELKFSTQLDKTIYITPSPINHLKHYADDLKLSRESQSALRPFQTGDSLMHIDWRRAAKWPRWMVRTDSMVQETSEKISASEQLSYQQNLEQATFSVHHCIKAHKPYSLDMASYINYSSATAQDDIALDVTSNSASQIELKQLAQLAELAA